MVILVRRNKIGAAQLGCECIARLCFNPLYRCGVHCDVVAGLSYDQSATQLVLQGNWRDGESSTPRHFSRFARVLPAHHRASAAVLRWNPHVVALTPGEYHGDDP